MTSESVKKTGGLSNFWSQLKAIAEQADKTEADLIWEHIERLWARIDMLEKELSKDSGDTNAKGNIVS